uniref:Uncharacterized protein n=1 Tax=Curvibacter symbiont subsp. Hydra magnipapillata TaxID=667019 RepID=C9YH83_CURXX|nr:hypothetical protein Csp_B21330 [Curvibacter putative symbiont of Hydra magnipapillata]
MPWSGSLVRGLFFANVSNLSKNTRKIKINVSAIFADQESDPQVITLQDCCFFVF